MFNHHFCCVEAQEIEKKGFSILKECWDSLNESQKSAIKKLCENEQKNGAICSIYGFIAHG